MKMVKLTDVENRLIKNLSKGYKQRVGLAQAILGFPEIIILDEPTVGLDPKQIIEIRELIRELAKKHTVILSSHILAEIQEVCDYIMIISGGKLVASDTPENLEKLLEGQRSVEILAKGTEDKVRMILKSIPEVKSADVKPGEEGGTTKASVIPTENQDIRENVFRAFAGADCPLLMLYHSRTTLEDVFLELTQKESAAVEQARTKSDVEELWDEEELYEGEEESGDDGDL